MKNQCCVCRKPTVIKFYKKIADYVLVKCTQCNLIYLKDVISNDSDFIKKAKEDLRGSSDREKVEYWSFPNLYKKYKKIFDNYFYEKLNRIKKFRKGVKSIFDIGCGYGFWLKFCNDKGLDVSGIDNSEEVIEWIKNNYNLPVEFGSLKEYQFKKKYDAIIMCDVLEHLIDPNSALEKIKMGLVKEGVLFLQVPNVLGFKLPLSHGYGLPFHLWQFNKHTLEKLLRKNGFRLLDCWTGVMGVIGIYENGGPSILDRLTWFFARRFGLGNRLMLIAQPMYD